MAIVLAIILIGVIIWVPSIIILMLLISAVQRRSNDPKVRHVSEDRLIKLVFMAPFVVASCFWHGLDSVERSLRV